MHEIPELFGGEFGESQATPPLLLAGIDDEDPAEQHLVRGID
ncbi:MULTISPECIES: hypothetical protein [Streptomyces]|uniref:Uncharacterized protein n=1 Tax=Streptomyces lienomycini TaxID=284035 RepID=A0ABV9X7G7_9ACTN|nr:hypothetical protein [Streptomyces sp. NBC_00334]